MWCVLAHCLGVEGLTWQERKRTVSCSGSFFHPKPAGRRGPRPPGWQPALADAGLDFSGLRAPQRRASGGLRLRVAANPVGGRTHVLQQRAPSGRRPAHRAASPAQLPLQPVQALVSRRGLTLGATPTNTGGCAEYKCPRCMARFAKKASWQRHRAAQCYRAHSESAAARAREEPAALQGQGLRRACAPDVLRGP